MMTIGQFARAGGLTVKALRFYDERGVLTPAAVDPDTGYRRYRPGQLREAVGLQSLRAADVPLDEARTMIDDADRTADLLDRFQERREAERARQDAAFVRARSVLDALRERPEVRERDAPGCSWVGMRWRHGSGDDLDDHGPAIEAEITALAQALHAASAAATGPPWFTYSSDGTATGSIMLGCLPVDDGPDVDVDALAAAVEQRVGSCRGSVERGWQPARREAYTRVPVPAVDEAGAGATLVPALIVLGEYLEDVRPDCGDELRQSTVADDDGRVAELEFSGTLPASGR